MSKFNHFAIELDDLANLAFADCDTAAARLRKAEDEKRKHPRPEGSLAAPEYVAAAARSEAEFAEASKAMLDATDRLKGAHRREIGAIRQRLEAEVTKTHMIDPARIDANTLELLKSGVCTPAEYVHLFNKAVEADNPTMARLIGKYAGDAAARAVEAAGGHLNDPTALELRRVENAGKQYDGRQYMEAFDQMAQIYNRACDDPRLATRERWERLTTAMIENF